MWYSLGAGGIGLLLAGIVLVDIWKDHGKNPPAKLALLAGMLMSGTLIGVLGSLVTGYAIFGAPVLAVVVVVGGRVFWIEGIKHSKPHRWRTPAVGFLVGAALTASFAGVQHAVDQGTVSVTSIISHTGTGR